MYRDEWHYDTKTFRHMGSQQDVQDAFGCSTRTDHAEGTQKTAGDEWRRP